MICTVFGNVDPILNCALAASMSYGKDLSAMSRDEKAEYVRKIWDKHTNVSEHYVQSLHLQNIPRFATLLMAFQRDGFTMTEMSQRRREVNWHSWDGDMYRDLIIKGAKFEDARKVLRCGVLSECIVTMNREAARNIIGIFNEHQRLPFFRTQLEELGLQKELAEAFELPIDSSAAMPGPKFEGFSLDMNAGDPEFVVDTDPESTTIWGRLPLYSFHQFARHRKILIRNWRFESKRNCCSISDVSNDATVIFECDSLYWSNFIATRSKNATQEPLRSFAKRIK